MKNISIFTRFANGKPEMGEAIAKKLENYYACYMKNDPACREIKDKTKVQSTVIFNNKYL